jgi:ABC-type multidrug transport system fused ATPase/permease subunit
MKDLKGGSTVVVLKEKDPRYELWSSNFLSKFFFIHVWRVIRDKKYKVRTVESAQVNTEKLQKEYEKSKKLGPALYATFRNEYLAIGIYKISWTVFTWLGAYYLLKLILAFLGNKQASFETGHILAVALFLSGFLSSIAIHQQYAESNRVALKVKAAVMGLLYRKTLRLSRVKGGAGAVINLMTSDMNRLNDFVVNFHFLWAAFVEVLLILVISFYEIGVSATPALGFIAILLPLQMYLGRRTESLGIKQANETTHRVHLMSELLTAIKLIKFYAWEMPFAGKIDKLREKEAKYVYDGLINKSVNYTVVFAIPVLVALTCLSTFVALGNPLTATVSFTVLSVFNTLRYPFFMLPMAVKSYVAAFAALTRFDEFMELEEVVPLLPSVPPPGCDLAVDLKDGDFKWDGSDGTLPTIKNINLKIKKGAKVGIVGDVGSGKSSLIAAMLGQIRQVRGDTAKIYGSTAYMSQEAWLLNMTLRQNVLFGKTMDKKRYNEVIRVCGLQRDLTLLIAGDQTEIAERGVNLSGGQRQRVSLARSVYYDADIILMDDPLSAVDQHVGRHIFEECFLKFLDGKTLIVAINQLQYLSQLDHIVFVQDGEIYAQGTYQELMQNNERFAKMVNAHVADGDYEVEDDGEGEVVNDKSFNAIEITVNEPKQSKVDYAEFNTSSVVSFNQLSVHKNVNEHTIRSLIEVQNATNILGAKESSVADIILRNELSQYSARGPLPPQILEEDEDENDKEALERGKLVTEDESTKTAGAGDFVAYAKAGAGVVPTLLTMFLFALVHGVRIGGDYWLRLWVPRVGNFSDAVYVGVYGAFTAVFTLGVFGRGYVFTRLTTGKANQFHSKLFDSCIHAPMAFYDTTPIARILACFSKHQMNVDDTMLDAGLQALQYFPLGFGALVLCAVLIPWNWIPSIVLVLMGYVLIRITNRADVETKSLEAITRPPIFSHLTATLEGLFSIRCYQAEHRFDLLNFEKIDINHANLMAMQSGKVLLIQSRVSRRSTLMC